MRLRVRSVHLSFVLLRSECTVGATRRRLRDAHGSVAMIAIATLLVTAFYAKPLNAQKPRGDRNRITLAEMSEAPSVATNAYDVIRAMRPQWLNPPSGRTSSSNVMGDGGGAKDVVLYIDDTRQPTLEDLRTIKSATIVEMRFLEQNRALQLRGPGHEMGVIEVTTISGKKK